jgi:hypothetical protein
MITQVVPSKKQMKRRDRQRGRRKNRMKTIRSTGKKDPKRGGITLQTRRNRKKRRS